MSKLNLKKLYKEKSYLFRDHDMVCRYLFIDNKMNYYLKFNESCLTIELYKTSHSSKPIINFNKLLPKECSLKLDSYFGYKNEVVILAKPKSAILQLSQKR